MWSILSDCHGQCHRVHTEATARQSTKVCHMFGTWPDLKMHIRKLADSLSANVESGGFLGWHGDLSAKLRAGGCLLRLRRAAEQAEATSRAATPVICIINLCEAIIGPRVDCLLLISKSWHKCLWATGHRQILLHSVTDGFVTCVNNGRQWPVYMAIRISWYLKRTVIHYHAQLRRCWNHMSLACRHMTMGMGIISTMSVSDSDNSAQWRLKPWTKAYWFWLWLFKVFALILIVLTCPRPLLHSLTRLVGVIGSGLLLHRPLHRLHGPVLRVCQLIRPIHKRF